MAELIISISGMRGIVGENLDEAIACEYGCAFGTFLKSSQKTSAGKKLTVCIGADNMSSPMAREAVEYYGKDIIRHPVGTGAYRPNL